MVVVPLLRLSEDDHGLLFQFLAKLHKEALRSFMRDQRLPISGTKEDILSRISDELATGAVNYRQLVALLDRFEPWDKQHVLLYGPPSGMSMTDWRNKSKFEAELRRHPRLFALWKTPKRLFLPDSLQISSIEHSEGKLRITALEKRVWWERAEDLDETSSSSGSRLLRKAYVEKTARGIIAFEWDFVTNLAMLQISQLPSYWKYEDAITRFQALLGTWLTLDHFPAINFHRAIAVLHKWAESTENALRYHGVEYQKNGRTLAGKSATVKDPLLGDEIIDEAMGRMREEGGIATEGNFFFLADPLDADSPLENDVHVVVLAQRRRISFPAANTEDALRYVIDRIREAGE